MIHDSLEICALGTVKMAHTDWDTNANPIHCLGIQNSFPGLQELGSGPQFCPQSIRNLFGSS